MAFDENLRKDLERERLEEERLDALDKEYLSVQVNRMVKEVLDVVGDKRILLLALGYGGISTADKMQRVFDMLKVETERANLEQLLSHSPQGFRETGRIFQGNRECSPESLRFSKADVFLVCDTEITRSGLSFVSGYLSGIEILQRTGYGAVVYDHVGLSHFSVWPPNAVEWKGPEGFIREKSFEKYQELEKRDLLGFIPGCHWPVTFAKAGAALLFAQAGLFEEAHECCRILIRSDPFAGHYSKGNVCELQENYHEAMTYYKKALTLFKTSEQEAMAREKIEGLKAKK